MLDKIIELLGGGRMRIGEIERGVIKAYPSIDHLSVDNAVVHLMREGVIEYNDTYSFFDLTPLYRLAAI